MSKRKPTRILPSVEYLRQCLRYNRRSGDLHWKTRPREHFNTDGDWSRWNTQHAGTIAGNITVHGYRVIAIGHRLFRAQRIIWKLVTGEEPPEQVDHEDGNQLNNAWRNLRPANQIESSRNTRIRDDNTSGYRGVSRNGKKWKAQIGVDNAIHHLGTFDTPEEASIAYEAAARNLFGAFYANRRGE